jgi:23S rRNA (adenine2503-C2)-methyltransferase
LEERKQLMPVEATYSFEDTLQILRKYNWHGQRRISFEYIVFGHLNDTPKHAEKLIQLLKGIPCRINLIRFHPGKDKTLQATNETVLQRFKEHLNAGGILTTIRASRGLDIDAACGLLSSRNNPSKPTDYDRDDDEES